MSQKTVIITGAATGLGRALALEAANRGGHALLVDVEDATQSVALIRAAGGRANAYRADISVYEEVAALARTIEQTHGAVHVLVNNAAAGGGSGKLDEADPAAVKRLFEVNVLGVFNGIHAFASTLRATAAQGQPAYILNVGSEHSLGVPPHVMPVSAYTASKYAILGLTQTAQRDFEGSGIQVSLLAPGWIRTQKIQSWIEASPERAAMIEPYAQTPEHVARCAWDGLLEGRPLIPTNPHSRAFAIEHARDLMEAAQQLPKVDIPAELAHAQSMVAHAAGIAAGCPMAQFLK